MNLHSSIQKLIFLIFVLILGLTIFSLGKYIGEKGLNQEIEEEIKTEIVVLSLTNTERVRVGLAPLVKSQQLTDSATTKACDMRDNDYWDHVSPDGTTPWDFFNDEDYDYNLAGENICWSTDGDACMGAWMDSEGHRDNILEERFKEMGIGVCGEFMVQHFGYRNIKHD